MLVLSRKLNESIVIDGRITVKVVKVDGDVVKLGIQAPASVAIHRQEVYDEILKNNQEALVRGSSTTPSIPKNLLSAKNTKETPSATASTLPASSNSPKLADGSAKTGQAGNSQKS